MFCAVEHLAISSSVLPQVFRFYVSDVVTKLKFSSGVRFRNVQQTLTDAFLSRALLLLAAELYNETDKTSYMLRMSSNQRPNFVARNNS